MNKDVSFRLYALAVIRCLQSASYAISIPFLSIYLYNVRGVPMSLVGSIIGIASIVGALLRIFVGRLSDIYPTRRIMGLGLCIRSVAFLGFSVLIWLNAHPWLFIIFFLFNSGGSSFFMTASDIFVAKNVDEANRPFAYSVLRVGGNVGFAIGPAVGGFISKYSYAFTFFMSFVLQVLCLFLLIFMIREDAQEKYVHDKTKISLFAIREDKNFLTFTIGTFILGLLMGQLVSTLSVYAKSSGLDNTQIGYLFSINGFMVVFFQIVLIKFVNLVGYKRGLIIGSVLYSIGYFLFSFASKFWHFSIGVVILTLGEMLAMPLLTTITSMMAPENKRGLYIGFLGFIDGLSLAIAPMIGGILVDAFFEIPVLIWGIIAGFGVASMFVFLGVRFK
ncbi:MAG TPA: MFS transporter [Candidatus Hydrothermia bacterium]|nr:MFS transporter [Candidatus Hydrothermia bacterium]HOL23338.1 MFS transporter [Candidatus Hydrothermia bacterium]HPO78479.1 MFS transporter [Candidatus Hydrothermia bacterium]